MKQMCIKVHRYAVRQQPYLVAAHNHQSQKKYKNVSGKCSFGNILVEYREFVVLLHGINPLNSTKRNDLES